QQSAREGALHNVLLATTYIRQDKPNLDRAIELGDQAVHTLSGQVSSTRCVRHVRRLVDDLTPYRRNPMVRRFCNDATDLLQTVST
ncbi:MAG TPA: hypothetical protein VFG35_00340, partial [Actinoplanes sp.]|nr:hypothetical protein [Actinoplanes sp.]